VATPTIERWLIKLQKEGKLEHKSQGQYRKTIM